MSNPQVTEVEDGELPSGSFDITILETGNAYVADNFQGDRAGKLIRSNNAQGALRRQKVIKGPWDGTGDFQLETKDTPRPEIGETFVADEDQDGTPEPFMVTQAGRTYAADDAFKCKVSITKMENPLPYASSGKTTAELAAGASYVEDAAITTLQMSAYLPRGVTLAASNPWSATGLPTGLTINASTGAITGTPTTVGDYYVTVKAAGEFKYMKEGALVTETRRGLRRFKITITAS